MKTLVAMILLALVVPAHAADSYQTLRKRCIYSAQEWQARGLMPKPGEEVMPRAIYCHEAKWKRTHG